MTESMKGWMCHRARACGESSSWMDGLKDMIAEVGLEAAMQMVASNPRVLWRPPGSLARDISMYMEDTGWSRGEVVGWLIQPQCAALLTRNAATAIHNLKSLAAHLGLAPPRAGLLLLLRTFPAAATSNLETMITNLDVLQQLQATHPMWEGRFSRLSPTTKLLMARSGPGMSRLCHVVKLGQQDLIAMSVAAKDQTSFMRKFPGYVAPSRAPRLSPEERDKQLEQYLARWQPWAASWGRLEESSLNNCCYHAQNPERLLRLEFLLGRGLQEGCAVYVALILTDKRWLVRYPGFSTWRDDRGVGR